MNRTRLLLRFAIGCLVAILLAGAAREEAGAHAALDRTDPPSNEVLAQSPGRVELRFTEPVEETYTEITLVDSSGAEVPGTSFGIDSGDATLVWLNIPDDLERDTYSVVWRTLSAADGHRLSGYFVFTIGTSEDVRTVVAPALGGESGPPEWLDTAGR